MVRVRARGDQRRREGSPAPDRRADDRSRSRGVTVSGGAAATITSGRGATATPVRAAIASHTCGGGAVAGPPSPASPAAAPPAGAGCGGAAEGGAGEGSGGAGGTVPARAGSPR